MSKYEKISTRELKRNNRLKTAMRNRILREFVSGAAPARCKLPPAGFPFRAIGRVFVEVREPGETSYEWMTGIRVTENVVLTCAHGIRARATRKWIRSAYFVPTLADDGHQHTEAPQFLEAEFVAQRNGWRKDKKSFRKWDYSCLTIDPGSAPETLDLRITDLALPKLEVFGFSPNALGGSRLLSTDTEWFQGTSFPTMRKGGIAIDNVPFDRGASGSALCDPASHAVHGIFVEKRIRTPRRGGINAAFVTPIDQNVIDLVRYADRL
ncbi:MAG: hypothetical protein AAGA95_00515 [Pseudomonadota bacterium]